MKVYSTRVKTFVYIINWHIVIYILSQISCECHLIFFCLIHHWLYIQSI